MDLALERRITAALGLCMALLWAPACSDDNNLATDTSAAEEGDSMPTDEDDRDDSDDDGNVPDDEDGAATDGPGSAGDTGDDTDSGDDQPGGPQDGDDNGQDDEPEDPGPRCTGGCDDGVDCTADECIADDTCLHTLDESLCEDGQSCHPVDGCTAGGACSPGGDDCEDDDGCTASEACDAATATCQFEPLDTDNDGHAPEICGGGDCNDADPSVGPDAVEQCNGDDDNCDGLVDNEADCGEGAACVEGECECADGFEQCGFAGGPAGGGFECVDLSTDPEHCGGCFDDCGPAGTCSDGQCACPDGAQQCPVGGFGPGGGDTECTDTRSSNSNCGDCGQPCALSQGGGGGGFGRFDNQLQTCGGGQCNECGGDGQPCCNRSVAGGFGQGGAVQCSFGFVCSGDPMSASAVCQVCGDTEGAECCPGDDVLPPHCGTSDDALVCGPSGVCELQG